MSTERRTDMGEYVLVEAGEPTVTAPSVWYSRGQEWKAGTAGANAQAITDYLVQRRARLAAIRTQAQAVSARAATSGNPTAAQMTALQTDIKTLAAAVDDLAQYDIRLGRGLLSQFDATDG